MLYARNDAPNKGPSPNSTVTALLALAKFAGWMTPSMPSSGTARSVAEQPVAPEASSTRATYPRTGPACYPYVLANGMRTAWRILIYSVCAGQPS